MNLTDLCPYCFCCRQFVRRRLKTLHHMKSVRGLYRKSARCADLKHTLVLNVTKTSYTPSSCSCMHYFSACCHQASHTLESCAWYAWAIQSMLSIYVINDTVCMNRWSGSVMKELAQWNEPKWCTPSTRSWSSRSRYGPGDHLTWTGLGV